MMVVSSMVMKKEPFEGRKGHFIYIFSPWFLCYRELQCVSTLATRSISGASDEV